MSSEPSPKPYFAVIVGAGLSGAVMAERIATQLNQRVLIVDKRDHIGGNVYDEVDPETGIRVSRYGPHLFHTNDKEVWEYLNQFGKWQRWDHRVLAKIPATNPSNPQQYVPVPANINTINALFPSASIATEAEMKDFMATQKQGDESTAKTSEDIALARVGPTLYDTLFKHYTKKQWGIGADQLDAQVLRRIPVRENFDDRYFADRYQALPTEGYTAIVNKMLDHPNITVRLHTDFHQIRHELQRQAQLLIYTGPIDAYFKDSGLPALQYRSIQFHKEVVDCSGYVLPASVVNYPSPDTPYTRTCEYKQLLHQPSAKSILISETSSAEGEPYYPFPTQENLDLYKQYQALAAAEEARPPASDHPKTLFLGRLATYKYINMDAAVRLALDAYKSL